MPRILKNLPFQIVQLSAGKTTRAPAAQRQPSASPVLCNHAARACGAGALHAKCRRGVLNKRHMSEVRPSPCEGFLVSHAAMRSSCPHLPPGPSQGTTRSTPGLQPVPLQVRVQQHPRTPTHTPSVLTHLSHRRSDSPRSPNPLRKFN